MPNVGSADGLLTPNVAGCDAPTQFSRHFFGAPPWGAEKTGCTARTPFSRHFFGATPWRAEKTRAFSTMPVASRPPRLEDVIGGGHSAPAFWQQMSQHHGGSPEGTQIHSRPKPPHQVQGGTASPGAKSNNLGWLLDFRPQDLQILAPFGAVKNLRRRSWQKAHRLIASSKSRQPCAR